MVPKPASSSGSANPRRGKVKPVAVLKPALPSKSSGSNPSSASVSISSRGKVKPPAVLKPASYSSTSSVPESSKGKVCH